MFPFNKNTELLETIEKQKNQIVRYENRLRDVVSAYKGLQNEKEALEASVKALTSSHSASPSSSRKSKSHFGGLKLSTPSRDSSRRSSGDSFKLPQSPRSGVTDEEDASLPSTKENVDDQYERSVDSEPRDFEEEESDESSNHEKDSELETLRHQICTLTVSLSTVSEEKSKIVATYQAEKKKLKNEKDKQLSECRDELEVLRSKKLELEEELVMAKEKTRSQQEDREQEQSTHSLMLRELQKMLNDERTKNEHLTSDLQETRKAVHKAASENKKSDSHEKQIKKFIQEIETTKEKLKAAKEYAKKPQPIVEKLQKQIVEMKAAHRIQSEKEHLQLTAAEERLKQVEEEGEERVASLEKQITQLSNQMGSYESSKTRDQILTRTLKERISQLEAENNILTKQVASVSTRGKFDNNDLLDEENLNIENLKQQIVKYNGLLKTAVHKSNDPMDVAGWIVGLDRKSDDDDYQKMYLESQQELQQLREEFEKYKVRAQNVLKTKRGNFVTRENAGLVATHQQYQELKDELEEVRERHFHLRSHCNGLEEQQTKLIKSHGEEITKQHLDHQKEFEVEKEHYTASILELEQEMRSQRERTVDLLAEKDKEIQHLQAYSNACHREYQSEYGGVVEPKRLASTWSEHGSYDTESNPKDSVTTDSVAEIMSQTPSQRSGQDTTVLHYVEQMARSDVSINGLRRHNKQLELQIRQLHNTIITKDEKYSREVAALEENIANFSRSKSRENANLEYLKNVMFQYLTTKKDQSARNRMLGAVTAILEFSPEETRKVLGKHKTFASPNTR